MEGEGELDRRIVELGYRCEGDVQGRGHSAEGQPYREGIVLDLEVPEAMLDDDGHLIREALHQVLGDRNSGRRVLNVM